MDSGQILGGVGIAISVIGSVIAALNHKRCRSRCCKRELSASIHIEDGTPPNSVPKLSTPPIDGNS